MKMYVLLCLWDSSDSGARGFEHTQNSKHLHQEMFHFAQHKQEWTYLIIDFKLPRTIKRRSRFTTLPHYSSQSTPLLLHQTTWQELSPEIVTMTWLCWRRRWRMLLVGRRGVACSITSACLKHIIYTLFGKMKLKKFKAFTLHGEWRQWVAVWKTLGRWHHWSQCWEWFQ